MIDPLEAEVAIFNEALDLPPDKRPEYLDRICRGNARLRQQVEALLAAHQQAEDFLEASPLRARAHLGGDKEGDKIGAYTLLQRIGEGGCGVVYMAQQQAPVRRRVALKVIRLGMDTERVIARFEAERQALAIMDHPNIAKVLDAGATETGRPYFVMELVRGVRITDYCEQNDLSTRDRLDLFVQVCRAIQHAHQKGIIHRDIKPSNILVTVNDGVPVPKVIDFGIAKATEGRLTDKTLFTAFEQLIGTPAYMSPEQAVMTSLDIDTRSDIYSLGVLLYELLTGRTPFDAKELLAAGVDEMRRTIREVDPVRPSTRLTQESALLPRRQRETIHRVKGDLDWIVMKCLEKDRARRYETANGLAQDIVRHLKNEPVSARPPSGLYRFQKAVRRNKTAFAAVAAVLAALIAGVIVSAWQAVRAKRAERQQVSLRQEAQSANRGLRDTVSVLELERAEDFFNAGDPGMGAAHLASMLRRDPSNHIAASRVISALAHRNWALPVHAGTRHAIGVTRLSFSPNGRHLLSTSGDNAAIIWNSQSGAWRANLEHNGRVTSAEYSPDGTRVVTASLDGTARLWSATNGSPLTPPLQHRGPVNWAEFSRDGTKVLSAGADKIVRVWDGSSGELLHQTVSQRTEISIARFSPDAKEIVTGSKHGSVRFFDFELGREIPRVGSHYDAVVTLAYSPDGRRLVSASAAGLVHLWNVPEKKVLKAGFAGAGPIDYAAFSPDSRLLLTGSHDGAAQVWDAETGKPVGAPLMHEARVTAASFSPDARKIVTISKDYSARLWSTRTRLPLSQPIREPQEIAAVAWSPGGTRLATGSKDGTIRVWQVQRGPAVIQTSNSATIVSTAFSHNGDAIMAASADGNVSFFQAATFKTGYSAIRSIRQNSRLRLAELSPDGNFLLTLATNGGIKIWDWRSQRPLDGDFPLTSRIRSVRFSPDSHRIVTGDNDGIVRVWVAHTWQPVTPALRHGREPVIAVAFSDDGELIGSASEDFTARIWDLRTGAPVGKTLVHYDHVKFVSFSPDGSRVVTASTDDTARVWDVRTANPLVPPLRHGRIVDKAVFSPDGLRVITASVDQTAMIWDARTGEALTPPMKHSHFVYNVAFSSDGERALTGCWNGVTRIWDSRTGQPLTEPLGTPDWNGRRIGFDPMGEQIAVGGDDAMLRYWHMPRPPLPVPDWFPVLAEAVAGVRLGTRGHIEHVRRGELEALRERLQDSNSNDFYERLARWFLADPALRAASPF